MIEPEMIIYNAGTDILDGDPLGNLKVHISPSKKTRTYAFDTFWLSWGILICVVIHF